MEEKNTAIILCAGGQKRWDNYLGSNKHLIEIEGERLIDRTVRLIKENDPSTKIYIVANTDEYNVEGTELYKPKLNKENYALDNWLSSKPIWDKKGRTMFFFGDIWFSDECMKTIFSDKDKTWKVYGREGSGSEITGKSWEEWFAMTFYPEDFELLEKALNDLVKDFGEASEKLCAGWSFYRTLIKRDPPRDKHFVDIHDFTEDFDYPVDYDNWIKHREMRSRKIENCKVVISIPSGRGEVPLNVMTHLIDMILFTKKKYPNISISILTLKMTYIHKARQTIAESFLETDADRMLCLDDDNVPKKDSLVKLLERDLPIVSGLYFRKSPPYEPLVMNDREGGIGSENRSEMVRNGDGKPFAVHSTGFGFILVKREVFEKIKMLGVPMFDIRGQMGEDVWFCLQARTAGFRTIIDPQVEIGHLGDKICVGKQTYLDYYKKSIETRIFKAKKTEGFLANEEIQYLADNAISSDYAIEIGSWKGKSAQVMSLAQKLWCIDKFDGILDGKDTKQPKIRDIFDKSTEDYKNIEVMEGDSSEIAKKFNSGIVNFIFIDGDHHYEQAKDDLEKYFPKLKSSGKIAVHDYSDNWKGVKQAVDEFVKENAPILVGRHVPNTTIYEIIKI